VHRTCPECDNGSVDGPRPCERWMMVGGYGCSAMSEVEEGVLTSVRVVGGPWYFGYFDEHGGRCVEIKAKVSLVFGQCQRRRC
jgi:hypothetical protein